MGIKIADSLGIRYDGIQEGVGMQFTDPITRSTFYGNTLEEVKDNYEKLKERYGNKDSFQKSGDNNLKLEDIKKAVNDILAKSETKNTENLVNRVNQFIIKYNEDVVVNDFLSGYKQLAMLGLNFPDTKLQKLYSLASQINIIKSLDRELKSGDRLELVISSDDIAHQLHTISKCSEPHLYPILDELADISKELGETNNRDDRLLYLNNSPPNVIEKFNELEIFQKGNLFETGKSYWKLMEKAIRHSVESLTNEELVILREWIFSRI